MKSLLSILFLCVALCSESYYYEYGKKVELTKLKEQRVVNDQVIKYYKNSAGQKIGIKDEIIVKCKSNQECKDIFEKYNLTKVENLTQTIALIKLINGENVFVLSQKLYLEDGIITAHPNFIKKRYRR